MVVDSRRRQDHPSPPSRLVRQPRDGGGEPAVVLHGHGAVGPLGRLPLAPGLHHVEDVVPDEREEAPDVLPELRLVGEAEVPLAHPEDEGVDLLLVHDPRIRAEAQLEHDLEEVEELGFTLPKGGLADGRLDAVEVGAHGQDVGVALHLLGT